MPRVLHDDAQGSTGVAMSAPHSNRHGWECDGPPAKTAAPREGTRNNTYGAETQTLAPGAQHVYGVWPSLLVMLETIYTPLSPPHGVPGTTGVVGSPVGNHAQDGIQCTGPSMFSG
jgi:hypothetical protein